MVYYKRYDYFLFSKYRSILLYFSLNSCFSCTSGENTWFTARLIVKWRSILVTKDAYRREGKIPNLSQANTSYYQVHKIQPITKHCVLLLDFAITTQKPTEICQVSCKKKIMHQRTCKRWHKGLIRLWHVSPIRLRHVSLTHPKTPINRSLPKAFKGDQTIYSTNSIIEDSEVLKLCWN